MDHHAAPLQPPALAALDRIEAALKELAGTEPTFLPLPDKREALIRVDRMRDRLEAVRLGLLAAAGDVAAEEGHRDAASWLASRLAHDRGPVARDLRVATSLDRRWHLLAAALREGAASWAQIRVVVRVLDRLHAETEAPRDLLAAAEDHLLGLCASHPPRELERLATKVLEVVAPDLYDDDERRRLEEAEHRAHRRTSLTTHRDGHGTTLIRARVPDATAARLMTLLHAFTAPRQLLLTGGDAPERQDRVPHDRRLGAAFCQLMESVDPAGLPAHGGDDTQIIVTMGLESLLHGIGAADLLGPDGPTPISAGQARRLACSAGLIPAVLDGESVPLDLGRSRRLFSPAQRKALRLRDRRCRAEGCSVPAPWCDAHHRRPWASGGHTNLAEGLLLCHHHHQRIHDPAYDHTLTSHGHVRFHRRR